MKASTHKETGEKMYVYEVGYLLVPKISEEKLPEEAAAIRTLIETHGGIIASEEFPNLRPLAYTMEKSFEARKEKYDDAYFGSIKFEMETSKISDLEKELSASKNILRHILIKTIKGNTMFSERRENPKKVATDDADVSSPENVSSESLDKQPASQEEIDKSIDALVIS